MLMDRSNSGLVVAREAEDGPIPQLVRQKMEKKKSEAILRTELFPLCPLFVPVLPSLQESTRSSYLALLAAVDH